MRQQFFSELRKAEDYQSLLNELLYPAEKYLVPTRSGVAFPRYYATSYDDATLEFESFARLLWGYYFATDLQQADTLFSMIDNGTNPDSEYYWGKVSDYSQKIVEMLPILLFCARHFQKWDKGTEEKKQQIGKWFYQINYVRMSENNWQCFRLLVNLLLADMGLPFSNQTILDARNKIESFYLGNGWYSDGKNRQRDYYISFAIHYYLLLSTLYCNDRAINEQIIARAKIFSKTFITWFSESGEALPFGRSMTYKFAQVAFWSMLVGVGADEENDRIYKGIINRNLRWWLKQDIFDEDGILQLGYAYGNDTFTEYYNGTGSSYWSLKAFALLLQADDTAFFSMQEEPLPPLAQRTDIPEALMTVCRNAGHPYAFLFGQESQNQFGHTECKYEKFVYSSLFPFCVSKSYTSLEMLANDCNLTISLNGKDCFARHACDSQMMKDGIVRSVWRPDARIRITSFIWCDAPLHYRIHMIESDIAMTLTDAGFACQQDEAFHAKMHDGIASLMNENFKSEAFSVIGNGEPICIHCAPNTNSVYARVAIPAIQLRLEAGRYLIVNAFSGDMSTAETTILPQVHLVSGNQISINGKLLQINPGNQRVRVPNRMVGILKKIKKELRRIKRSI